MNWLSNIGVASGMPKYIALLGFMLAAILLIPEFVWTFLGVNYSLYLINLPLFIQYLVNSCSFKNSMFIFWLVAPIVFLVNTLIYTLHLNFKAYSEFLMRRELELKYQNKSWLYPTFSFCFIYVLGYIWATAINLREPSVFGDFIPAQNRLVMLVIHGGSLALVLPLCIAFLVVELRTILTFNKKL